MRHQSLLTYTTLGIVVLGVPLFLLGYIQTFDMAWGTHFATSSTNNGPLFQFLNFTSTLIPGWIIQKILLLLITVLSGLGIHKLVTSSPLFTKYPSLPYFAGILYIFNPFFYTRLMSGQWLVLLGYALLPWAILTLYKFLQKPSWRASLPVILSTVAIGLTSIHTIGILVLAAAGLVIASGKKKMSLKVKWGSLIATIWLVINSFWLIPLLTGHSQTASDISAFTSSQTDAFATKGTILNSPPLSAALLTGFWADDQGRYQLPSALPIWWIGVLTITILVIMGGMRVYKRRDKLGLALMITGFTAWLLAIGSAWFVTKPLTDLLTYILPLYAGYREPQKWLMLLAVSYAYLGSIGAAVLLEKLSKTKQERLTFAAICIIFISPFLYAPNLAFGAGGQLKSTPYPREWEEAKTYLNTHARDKTTLVLPWHMYLPIGFTGRVVANPAPYFFDQPLVVSDDPELKGVPPKYRTDTIKYIDQQLIPLTVNHRQTGKKLADHNIQYVLLLKEADWWRYNWLEHQQDLPVVLDNNKLRIYKVITE